MKAFLQKIDRKELMLFFCAALLWSLLYSKFVISVSMILLVACGVFDIQIKEKTTFRFHPFLKENARKYWSNNIYPVLSIFFIIVLVSGIYSTDMAYWGERLRLKLPFILFPFAFASMPKLRAREYLGVFYFFLGLLFVSSLLVGFDYWMDYEKIADGLGRGRPVPTPCNHIRYSLMMAFSIIAGGILFLKNFYIKYPWERWLILGMTVFLILFIHILSVRSGLLTLYLSIVILSLRYAFLQKKYLIGGASALLVLCLPLIAYKTIEGFKNRVDYTFWDWQQYQEDKTIRSSDAARMVSLKIGYQIFGKNLWLGVGAGDLRKEVHQIYRQEYPDVTELKMPHNQLLSVAAGTGIIGLCFFLFTFFFPFFYRKKSTRKLRVKSDALFVALHLIIFFSFLMENTLENSLGVAFYVFFLLLGVHYLSEEEDI